MTEGNTDDLLEAIDRYSKEYDTRREREKKRHQKKMAEINDNAEQTWDDIAHDAGLDAVSELHEEIREIVLEFLDLRNDIKNMVYDTLTDHLSGGYNKNITVKRGKVYKYNRKRSSTIPFMQLVSGIYRDDIHDALRQDANNSSRKKILLCFDTIDTIASEPMSCHGYDAVMDYDGEGYDDLKMKYKARERHTERKKAFYIKLLEEGRNVGGRFISPTSRTPEDLKFLIQYSDEILSLQNQIHEDYIDAIDQLHEVKSRLETDLPDEA